MFWVRPVQKIAVLASLVAMMGTGSCSGDQQDEPPLVAPLEGAEPAAGELIRWRVWGEDAFAEARKRGVPVLLDLTAVWCHWCHRLDEDSWSNPAVIELVHRRFVPIQVWADERPDIESRYLGNGWPTVSILNADGFAFDQFGYTPPDPLIERLNFVADAYTTRSDEIVEMIRRNREQWARPQMAPTDTVLNHQFADNLAATFVRQQTNRHGAFAPHGALFPHPQLIRFALLQHARTGNPKPLEAALELLDGMAGLDLEPKARAARNIHGLLDRVSGGFFRYATGPGWNAPHYEKLLDDNAMLITAYLDAWAVTGNAAYRKVALQALEYVASTLTDPETGRFYGSQDADLYAHVPGTAMVDGEEYYPLSEKERAKLGAPHVDTNSYADSASLMISSYAAAFAALGDERYRLAANRAATFIQDNMIDENGHVASFYSADGRLGPTNLLSSHVGFARALLDLYQIDSRGETLQQAIDLMKSVEAAYLEPNALAYQDLAVSDTPLGRLDTGHLPLALNATAARNWIHIEKFTDGKKPFVDAPLLRQRVESILRLASFSDAAAQANEMASVAISLENFLTTPALFRVVGHKGNEKTENLVRLALRHRTPIKLVQRLDLSSDRQFLEAVSLYPKTVETFEPAIYLCAESCSAPVRSSEKIQVAVKTVVASRGWNGVPAKKEAD